MHTKNVNKSLTDNDNLIAEVIINKIPKMANKIQYNFRRLFR